jgi:hypothetical protein
VNKRQVWRFSCEFCKRGWFDRKKCAAHESRCIKNADRVCGFCLSRSITQTPLPELLDLLDDHGLDVDRLRDAAKGCPMCMLAAVSTVNRLEGWRRSSEDWWWFDYRAEMAKFAPEEVPLDAF